MLILDFMAHYEHCIQYLASAHTYIYSHYISNASSSSSSGSAGSF
jgi:hypothetical protein